MPNIKSAMKRLRQNEKRRLRNAGIKTRVKTAVKKARQATEDGTDAAVAVVAVQEAARVIDRAVTKGVIHKKTAARKKSRLRTAYNRAFEKAAS